MFITKSRYSASTMIVLVARLKVRAQERERERERERESARAYRSLSFSSRADSIIAGTENICWLHYFNCPASRRLKMLNVRFR